MPRHPHMPLSYVKPAQVHCAICKRLFSRAFPMNTVCSTTCASRLPKWKRPAKVRQ